MVAALAAVGLGVLGLAVGSFLNVVAHRVPEGASVVSPASACPSCGQAIRPRDNIPIVSWILLRGRCRECGDRISVRYPIVEAGTALLFVATVPVVGIRWVLPAYLWFGAVTAVLVLTDLDHHRIPNRILYPGVLVGGALLAAGALLEGSPAAFLRALGGGAAFFLLLLGIALVARGGFGFGDVKLGVLLGMFLAYLSWAALVAGVFLGFLAGGLAAIALLVAGRKGRKDPIPFGPAMVLGAWIGVAYGEPLMRWYLG